MNQSLNSVFGLYVVFIDILFHQLSILYPLSIHPKSKRYMNFWFQISKLFRNLLINHKSKWLKSRWWNYLIYSIVEAKFTLNKRDYYHLYRVSDTVIHCWISLEKPLQIWNYSNLNWNLLCALNNVFWRCFCCFCGCCWCYRFEHPAFSPFCNSFISFSRNLCFCTTRYI